MARRHYIYNTYGNFTALPRTLFPTEGLFLSQSSCGAYVNSYVLILL
jgi:hypothetical protein